MTEVNPKQPSPGARWMAIVLLSCSVLLAAYGIFELGALWNLHRVIQSWPEPLNAPDPFLGPYLWHSLMTLWPLPAAASLMIGSFAFRSTRRWRWVPVLAAVLWLAAYPLVKPPQVYFYLLSPVQSR